MKIVCGSIEHSHTQRNPVRRPHHVSRHHCTANAPILEKSNWCESGVVCRFHTKNEIEKNEKGVHSCSLHTTYVLRLSDEMQISGPAIASPRRARRPHAHGPTVGKRPDASPDSSGALRT